MTDACEPLAAEPAERLLALAAAHPSPAARADLLAVLSCVALPEQLRPRLAVTLIDALSDAEPELFPDLVRTAAGSDAPAVVMWVRAFAATPGPRRHAALEALVDVGDPDVGIELEHLMRSPDPADRRVAARLTQRHTRRAPRLRNGDAIPPLSRPEAPAETTAEPPTSARAETSAEALEPPRRAGDLPAPETAVEAPPTPPDDPWRPTYHGILRVVGSRWFELMQRHPPIHATSLPPERLGPLLVDRLLDSAVAGGAAEPLDLREWPAEMPSETAVRLARSLNGAYLPDRTGLFRRYRLARRGEGPDLAVSAQSLAELAGVGAPEAAVTELLGPLLSGDPRECAEAAAFLRTALEQAAAARRHRTQPAHT